MSIVLVAALATVAQAKPACRKRVHDEREALSAGDHAVRACFERPKKCYALALDGGVAQWQPDRHAPKPPPPEPDLSLHVTAKVCSGGTCHSYTTPDEVFNVATTYRDGDTVVGAFDDAIVLFDAATGAERARALPGLNVRKIGFVGDRLIVFDQDSTVLLDRATAKVVANLGNKSQGAWLDLGDGTIALTEPGKLIVIDRMGRTVHSVALGDNVLPNFLVQSRDKRLLAFDGAHNAAAYVDTTTWTAARAPSVYCP